MMDRMNCGNSVGNYVIYHEDCETCGGIGELQFNNRKELMVFIRKLEGVNFEDMMDVYREWRDDGVVTCPDCNGSGMNEIWI